MFDLDCSTIKIDLSFREAPQPRGYNYVNIQQNPPE